MNRPLRTAIIGIAFLGLVAGESVNFSPCTRDDDRSPNCTVQEVMVSPCAEAESNQPCKIKRGKSASIQFRYVPDVSSDNCESKVYWAASGGDLPLGGMNTNGCLYTECPIQENTEGTYIYQLKIARRYPTRTYPIKWKLWSDSMECCFLTNIKIVK